MKFNFNIFIQNNLLLVKKERRALQRTYQLKNTSLCVYGSDYAHVSLRTRP
jgi:hypothetical protein